MFLKNPQEIRVMGADAAASTHPQSVFFSKWIVESFNFLVLRLKKTHTHLNVLEANWWSIKKGELIKVGYLVQRQHAYFGLDTMTVSNECKLLLKLHFFLLTFKEYSKNSVKAT